MPVLWKAAVRLADENFNAAGNWRTEDSYQMRDRRGRGVGKRKTWTIDASGAFHKGPAFNDYHELPDLIADREEDFAHSHKARFDRSDVLKNDVATISVDIEAVVLEMRGRQIADDEMCVVPTQLDSRRPNGVSDVGLLESLSRLEFDEERAASFV